MDSLPLIHHPVLQKINFPFKKIQLGSMGEGTELKVKQMSNGQMTLCEEQVLVLFEIYLLTCWVETLQILPKGHRTNGLL
jgi:hypothetical protein